MVGPMTRIIGGSAGGRALRTPAGSKTRPTSDRVREALFSALESRLGTLRGRAFLDVYAGSGAVGLEAASRGASHVTFVERDRAAASLISQNARTLGLTELTVLSASATALAAGGPAGTPVGVVFLDPPYEEPNDAVAGVLAGLASVGWLVPRALVVVERGRRGAAWTWPAGFEPAAERRYGDTVLWYATWRPDEED